MTSAVLQSTSRFWSVRPMSCRQVPLVVWWIASIDPNVDTDQPGLITIMNQELIDARKLGCPEYYVGYFSETPMYFLVGFRDERTASFEIATLLVGPLVRTALHFRLYQQMIRLIFRRRRIGRITWEIEAPDPGLRLMLREIGFKERLVSTARTRRLVTMFYLDKRS